MSSHLSQPIPVSAAAILESDLVPGGSLLVDDILGLQEDLKIFQGCLEAKDMWDEAAEVLSDVPGKLKPFPPISNVYKTKLAKLVQDRINELHEAKMTSLDEAIDANREIDKKKVADLKKFKEAESRLQARHDSLADMRVFLKELEKSSTSQWRHRLHAKIQDELSVQITAYEADLKALTEAKEEIKTAAEAQKKKTMEQYVQMKKYAAKAIRALQKFAGKFGVEVQG